MSGLIGFSARLVRRSILTSLLVALVVVLAPPTPSSAQSSGEGIALAADFRGNGRTQIATLYDPFDDDGLRIDVLEPEGSAATFGSRLWFLAGAGQFDLARTKAVAIDVDGDGRRDLALLYRDGATSVRLLVFRSTGTSFTYMGTWWQSDEYAWDRVEELLAASLSASGREGLVLVYQYDGYQMRMHHFESTGSGFIFKGNGGLYDSGPGQYDATRAEFLVGRFTRTLGPQQIVAVYQYPNARVRIHLFDPTSAGLKTVNGWSGIYDSGEGQLDLDRAKLVASDIDGDGRTDLVAFYGYDDGSTRIHVFEGARNLAPRSFSTSGGTAPGTLAWGPSRVLAGDWYGDRRGHLAVLTPFANGATEASTFRNAGGTFGYTGVAWTTPWYEIRQPVSEIGLATPANFCQTHRCIANFPSGRGYVVMCADGQYSQSGGIQGACSYHGGVTAGSKTSHYIATGGSRATAVSGSHRPSSSISASVGRSQYVSGYYRRNGTYVAPYYRRPATRRR